MHLATDEIHDFPQSESSFSQSISIEEGVGVWEVDNEVRGHDFNATDYEGESEDEEMDLDLLKLKRMTEEKLVLTKRVSRKKHRRSKIKDFELILQLRMQEQLRK